MNQKDNPTQQQKSLARKIATGLSDGNWYFIDENGNRQFDQQYSYANPFSNGLSCVSLDGLRTIHQDATYGATYFAIDHYGHRKNIQSDRPFTFKEDRAIINWGEQSSLIDRSGKVIKTVKLKSYSTLFENKFIVMYEGGKIECWDRNGNVLFQLQGVAMSSYKEGMAKISKAGKYGFIDEQGKIVIPPSYELVSLFSESKSYVVKDDAYYFIDKHGNQVLGPYLASGNFSDSLAAVQTPEGWNFIDHTGTLQFDTYFDDAGDFDKEICQVRIENNWYIMNRNQKLLLTDADKIINFENTTSVAFKNNKVGIIDYKGKWIIPPMYDKMTNLVDHLE